MICAGSCLQTRQQKIEWDYFHCKSWDLWYQMRAVCLSEPNQSATKETNILSDSATEKVSEKAKTRAREAVEGWIVRNPKTEEKETKSCRPSETRSDSRVSVSQFPTSRIPIHIWSTWKVWIVCCLPVITDRFSLFPLHFTSITTCTTHVFIYSTCTDARSSYTHRNTGSRTTHHT